MRWLSNTNSDGRYIMTSLNETPEDAVKHHREWLAGKIIGDPKATAKYTVEQLKAMGMVGVYLKDGDDA